MEPFDVNSNDNDYGASQHVYAAGGEDKHLLTRTHTHTHPLATHILIYFSNIYNNKYSSVFSEVTVVVMLCTTVTSENPRLH